MQSTLLKARYFSSSRPTGLEGRPSSTSSSSRWWSHRLGTTNATRKHDASHNNTGGGGTVRRVSVVRASSGAEPRRGEKHGLDVRRGGEDWTRYHWQEEGEPLGQWDNFDSDIAPRFTPSSSEVWDCYDAVPPQASGSGGGGDRSIEESSDANRAMTPEKEFMSYAMKMPRAQLNGIDLMNSDDRNGVHGATEVYVLLFGVGEAATEGIYSLRSHCHETGLHHETIICFESSEDAARFSGLLEASMPHVSTVHTIQSSELIQFCLNSGYDCRLELEGSTLMPPEFNVGITDWERSMKLRQGHYQVLENEPDVCNTDNMELESTNQESALETNVLQDDYQQEGFTSQFDEMRARLERLLPED